MNKEWDKDGGEERICCKSSGVTLRRLSPEAESPRVNSGSRYPS